MHKCVHGAVVLWAGKHRVELLFALPATLLTPSSRLPVAALLCGPAVGKLGRGPRPQGDVAALGHSQGPRQATSLQMEVRLDSDPPMHPSGQ